MEKYRSKSHIVSAQQWRPGVTILGVWRETLDEAMMRADNSTPRYFVIDRRDQRVYLEPGDWVIKETDGARCTAVKAAEFGANYERVDEGTEACGNT